MMMPNYWFNSNTVSYRTFIKNWYEDSSFKYLSKEEIEKVLTKYTFCSIC